MKKLERAGKWLLDRLVGWVASSKRGAEPGEFTSVREILVVRPHNQMGDMLLCTPLLAAIRRGFLHARITLVASPDNWEVMVAHPDVDDLLVFDKGRFLRKPGEALAFLRKLRRVPWDLVLMPTTVSFSVTSAVIARLAGGNVRVGCDGRAYGRTMGQAIFHIHVPCRWKKEHQSDRNLDFARAVRVPIPTRTATMGLTHQERSWARAEAARWKLGELRLIGVHPGAGKLSNRWPVKRFADVIRKLAADEQNCVFVMVGPREKGLQDAIRDLVGDLATYLPDFSIRQAAAWIQQFDIFLCNDTGVMHIAAALGTQTLAIFGPTDPRQWAPISPSLRWLRGDDERADGLAVDDVLSEISRMLDSPAGTGTTQHAEEPSTF